MTTQLLGPNNEKIAYFAGDRLIFYKEACTSHLAWNLMQRGIEILDSKILKELNCKRHITYPPEKASNEHIRQFRAAFEKYYYPVNLAPNRFKLLRDDSVG